jgi:hypothetical protein
MTTEDNHGDVFGDQKLEATEDTVERAMFWQQHNAKRIGEAIAQRQHLEQWLKVVEAQEKAKHKEEPAHVQEREARSSEAYRHALEAYRDASAIEQTFRFVDKFANTVIDVWRTKCANERRP